MGGGYSRRGYRATEDDAAAAGLLFDKGGVFAAEDIWIGRDFHGEF